MNEQNPRQIAARVLAQRLDHREFTENLLETALAHARLSPVNRGLCHELVCGVVRWQKTLDTLIARKTDPSREPSPALKNLLRLGLYQIFWLDKIPPHAAVHETVELAKKSGYGAQTGFVNAVLRGYLREADAVKKILADMKISNPALGWSHPEWLVEKWRKNFGDENTRQLLEWNNTPPKTFARVNSLKFCSSRGDEAQISKPKSSQSLLTSAATDKIKNIGDLLAFWRDENVEYDFVRRDWLDENLVFELKSHPSLSSLPTFRGGFFYLQDPGTLLAPNLLNPKSGETILDLCAAPGGKTTFLAQLMNNEGKIIASDISEDRLKLVRENCRRLGVTCVDEFTIDDLRLMISGATNFPPTNLAKIGARKSYIANRQFDKILVDAPCSNTGVLRRRVDLRWRISPEEISRLQKTQLELLQLAATKLKSGGVLIYSTCSLETEENSEVVKQFLAAQPNFKLETERQLSPFADNVDGAYVARLKQN